jgi:hypothetical protein
MAEVGRPAHFNTPEELQAKADEYFEWVKGEFHEEVRDKTDKEGTITQYTERIWDREPVNISITGLALFLGFESRQSIYDYSKTGEFSYIIKRCKLQVENRYENALAYQSPTGAIFALKNMGWVDNQAIDHTTKGDSLNKPKDLSMLSDEELRQMATIQKKINA